MSEPIRLLYAEDDPRDADLTRTRFEREGRDVRLEVVETGARCLERLAAEAFDLLLLDNHLPDMDGLDVLAELRAEGHTLPVVMVTGAGDEETVARALHAGAVDYVPKSADYLETLPDLLRGLLARERSRRQVEKSGAPRVQRILHVEPNEMDAELTASHFAAAAPHLHLDRVTSGPEALSRLAPGHDFDLVLTDLRLPGMSALELLREAQHRGIDLPFVVITGRGDEATAVAILRLGAADYVLKRENYLTRLPHAIDHALHRFRLDRTTRRLQAELEALNATLEEKVAARTAALQSEIEVRKRAEEALRIREAQLSLIHDNVSDVLFVLRVEPDDRFRFISINRRFIQATGLPEERVVGKLVQDVIPHPALALVVGKYKEAIQNRKPAHWEEVSVYPAGRKVGEVTVAPVFDTSGNCTQLIGTVHDITERKQAEQRIRELNRLLKTISEINQLIVRTEDREPLLSEACRILVEHGGFRMAWIGFADPESGHVVPAARAGEGADYLDGILIRFDDTPEGRGPTGTAIRTGQHVVVADLTEKPIVAPWLGRQCAHGYVSVGAFPIRVHGEATGALSIYAGEPSVIGAEETALLDELAADIGYALQAMDDRAERRRAEAALREAGERLRLVVEGTGTGLWDWDLRTDRVHYSREWKRLLGYEEDEVGDDLAEWRRLTHPDDAEPTLARVAAFVERPEATLETEFRMRHKNGEFRWIASRAIARLGDDGKAARLLGMHFDITDRKRVEAALRESEEKFKNLFNNAEVGMFRSRLDGSEFLDVNEKYLSMLGRTREESIGKPSVILWADPKEREEMVRTLKAEGHVDHLECRLVKKDGKVINCITSLRLIPEEGVLEGSIIDITDRKRAEEQLHALALRLQSVREEEATRIAREIHDEPGQNLTALKMDLSWLGKELAGRSGSPGTATLLAHVDGMKDLVDQTVRTIQRISEELRPAALDKLGLSEAVDAKVEEFQKRTGISSSVKFGLMNVPIDPDVATAAYRIIQELLTNVARHAEASKVEVLVEEVHGELVLEVRDNGRGITKAELASPKSLGLAGIRERASLAGGSFGVECVPGRGTRATARLPLRSREPS